MTLQDADNGPSFKEHPLSDFLDGLDELLHSLVIEEFRQEQIAGNFGNSQEVRNQASVDALELESRIELLQAERNDFLVGVVTATKAPSQALVDETKKLTAKLATLVVAANKVAAILQVADAYMTAATNILNGTLPGSPPPAPPAAGDEPEPADAG